MQAYQRSACYFPSAAQTGLAEQGIDAGTLWADLPERFVCPEGGTPKTGFIHWLRA